MKIGNLSHSFNEKYIFLSKIYKPLKAQKMQNFINVINKNLFHLKNMSKTS